MTTRTLSPRRRDPWGYLFILPSFVILLLCFLIPIVMDVFYSMTEYNIIQSPRFVGVGQLPGALFPIDTSDYP